jgi:hypothetical protein
VDQFITPLSANSANNSNRMLSGTDIESIFQNIKVLLALEQKTQKDVEERVSSARHTVYVILHVSFNVCSCL